MPVVIVYVARSSFPCLFGMGDSEERAGQNKRIGCSADLTRFHTIVSVRLPDGATAVRGRDSHRRVSVGDESWPLFLRLLRFEDEDLLFADLHLP